jgi:ribosome biogenesis protein NSA1
MRVVIGDETGLVKNVSLEAGTAKIICGSSQSRHTSARYLQWLENDVVVARTNGCVDCLSMDGSTPWNFTAEGAPIGLDVLPACGSIVRCNSAGIVQVVNPMNLKLNPPTFNVGQDIHTMHVDPFGSSVIAIGGKERDLNLWSLETQQAIFKAKNVTHDDLDMRVPVWVKATAFLEPSQGHRLIVGTAYHQIRIYDTHTKRRPVLEASFGELPITSLVVKENCVIFGDTAGNINMLDIRNFKHLGRYAGPSGAIRDMSLHPKLPYLAAVGLDRMVHVYHIETRKSIYTFYGKQRLNAVLFADEDVKPTGPEKKYINDTDSEEAEEEYEGLEIDENSSYIDTSDEASDVDMT